MTTEKSQNPSIPNLIELKAVSTEQLVNELNGHFKNLVIRFDSLEKVPQKYTYVSDSPLFRSLTEEDEKEFRTWARENYVSADQRKEVWHPVVRDEMAKMDAERSVP